MRGSRNLLLYGVTLHAPGAHPAPTAQVEAASTRTRMLARRQRLRHYC
ncbi:MAG: hypothetical protein R2709_06825 [Marmoricola sp.]